MPRTLVKHALDAAAPNDTLLLQGWVRTRRDAKAFSFIELNDGSCLKGIQVIADAKLPNYTTEILHAHTGASVEVRGKLVPSQGQGQKWEVIAESVVVLGLADATYPLQKKGHTLEFLREIAHLRPRSNLFGAVFRVRSRLAYAVHQFFQERNFHYVHTPIITASDAEGAGDMFRVTTLDLANPPKTGDGKDIDHAKDFFGKKTFLTVSGQLEGEIFAHALSNIYTFGPTFRAEKSKTRRHLTEFWMVEPEMAENTVPATIATTAKRPGKFLIKRSMPSITLTASPVWNNTSPISTNKGMGVSAALDTDTTIRPAPCARRCG